MIKVLHVAAEAAPFVKTGGLGDVTGSLPLALRRAGVDARVMIPKYQSIAADFKSSMNLLGEFTVPVGWRKQYCGLQELELNGLPFYFIDNMYYFQRPYPYGHFDEAERYAYFCRAVLQSLPYLPFIPDLIHCHDWQTGLVSVYLNFHYRHQPLYKNIGTLFTIHNLKYQGVFPKEVMGDIVDLSWEHFTADKIEFFDQVNFLKSGLVYSDLVTTVSPSYSGEIQYEFFGEHLDGMLRGRVQKLKGIINGIDYNVYDPATDKNLFRNFDTQSLPHKAENKINLQEQLGLSVSRDIPLVAIISRLVNQKGMDLIARVLDEIAALDLQLVILGTGEDHYQHMFWYAAGRYPRKVSANIFFDEILARRIYAAADILLMPSMYEPCGLAQLIAMRYGCLPLVRETGGLKDTVISYVENTGAGNGFSFSNYNAHDMLYTLRRALDFYRKPKIWNQIVANAMNSNFSWDKSAKQYQILYKSILFEEVAHGTENIQNWRAGTGSVSRFGSDRVQGTLH